MVGDIGTGAYVCKSSIEFDFEGVVGFLCNLWNTYLELASMRLAVFAWRSGGGLGFGNGQWSWCREMKSGN